MNLPYVESTTEKLPCILRSTSYTENNLRKLLCQVKDWVAIENKGSIVYNVHVSALQ